MGSRRMTNNDVSQDELAFRFLEVALASYRDEYRELAEDWRALDRKAQGTVAIAGIFIAAALAFLDAVPIADAVTTMLLAIAVTALATSVVFAVLALRIREVRSPPPGDRITVMARDLSAPEEPKTDISDVVGFLNEQIEQWRPVNRDVRKHYNAKTQHMGRAQFYLTVAIIAVAVLALKQILL